MNLFYQKKATVPREARSGELRDRLTAWRDKRLMHVAAACEKTTDKFRLKFGALHLGFAKNVDKILEKKDSELVGEVEMWINNLEESFSQNQKGANHDAVGLCGAELSLILNSYLESSS
tara:strand:+ start:342 stop:698 length:357 start_codon:yes stop_codon:yes gene_type:complete